MTCEETADALFSRWDQHDPFVKSIIKTFSVQSCLRSYMTRKKNDEKVAHLEPCSVLFFFSTVQQAMEGWRTTLFGEHDNPHKQKTKEAENEPVCGRTLLPLQAIARLSAVAQTTWREEKEGADVVFRRSSRQREEQSDPKTARSRPVTPASFCPANCSATTIRSDWLRSF